MAHSIIIWQYQSWFVNQTCKKKLPNWKTVILPELLHSEVIDIMKNLIKSIKLFKDSAPLSNKNETKDTPGCRCMDFHSFLKFLLRLDVKISCVTESSHTEESALLLPLKELYWELYYARLKSKISDYEQLTGQLKVVKSFTCNTPKILKCYNI